MFKFNEAISMVVNCETQGEVDHYWERLLEGGEPSQCGWLKDRFGLSWQIVPTALVDMVQDKDAARSQRVMAAMLDMRKLDIAGLKQAYEA
jgi:predicted 3-demethylubiquinone-9 3-methyltransferase (glyoxalase superfamily)